MTPTTITATATAPATAIRAQTLRGILPPAGCKVYWSPPGSWGYWAEVARSPAPGTKDHVTLTYRADGVPRSHVASPFSLGQYPADRDLRHGDGLDVHCRWHAADAEAAPGIASEDAEAILAELAEQEAQAKARAEAAQELAEAAQEKGAVLLAAAGITQADHFPRGKAKGAKAVLRLRLIENESDLMTDYHGHKTKNSICIALVGERVAFRAWRKALLAWLDDGQGPKAAGIADQPETLARLRLMAEEGDEHRENYSMGGGYYISEPGAGRHCSGWQLDHSCGAYSWARACEAAGAGTLTIYRMPGSTPARTATQRAPKRAAANSGAGAVLEQHTHTKRDFEMHMVVPQGARMSREDWQALTNAAKAEGGWYSRAWQCTPGGWAFKDRSAAEAFLAAHFNTATKAPTKAAPSTDRARAQAEVMRQQAAEKTAPRLENTPKRQAQAASSRIDGHRLERAADYLEAWADAVDAGLDMPKQPTKAALLKAAAKVCKHFPNGWHAIPYEGDEWTDESEEATTIRAWLEIGAEAPEAEEARAKETEQALALAGLRNSQIPGFFPTPETISNDLLEEVEAVLGTLEGAAVLEPSAGKGDLAQAAQARGADVLAWEINGTLAEYMRQYVEQVERRANKGKLLVEQADFLERPAPVRGYDAVLLNPPYERNQALHHIQHAWAFIRPGGVLAAVVPCSVVDCINEPRHSCKARALWSDWIRGMMTADEPEVNAHWTEPRADFQTAGAFRQAGVMVQLLIMVKPVN